MGGQFLSKKQVTGQLIFVGFIFLLGIGYITLNLQVQHTQTLKSRNEAELKNLRADYTSKAAKLQNRSSREQIKVLLEQNGSTLKTPEHPAYRVKKVEQN